MILNSIVFKCIFLHRTVLDSSVIFVANRQRFLQSFQVVTEKLELCIDAFFGLQG